MTFEEWKEAYGLVYEPNYSAFTEADCLAAFHAGVASRDAEVARLKTVPMRYRRMAFNAQLQDEVAKLENECDQLREQIASLKDELRQISTAIDDVRLDLTNTAAELIMEMKEQLASRDAEVVSLTNQRDYEYVRAENAEQERGQLLIEVAAWRKLNEQADKTVDKAEQERDQLREQVTRMRDALESMSALGVMAVYNGSPHWIFPIKVMHRSNEALAATEPKP